MCALGVEDDKITTEAGAFYDGLILRLCLQRLKRNSADIYVLLLLRPHPQASHFNVSR